MTDKQSLSGTHPSTSAQMVRNDAGTVLAQGHTCSIHYELLAVEEAPMIGAAVAALTR